MHKLAVPQSGWCNISENYVICSWRLEKEAHVFIVSIVYSIFVLQELEMEPSGVSGTVTIWDQRSYIKIATLRGNNVTEIYDALNEICGELTVDCSTVCCWANSFHGGCVTQDQEGQEHQQMKQVWSLWLLLLKKIIVQNVKNFLEPWAQNLCKKMHKDQPQLLVVGLLILYDNARPHITDVLTKKLCNYGWEVLPQAPYSPDMSPPDFDLFPKLKEFLCGRWFSSLEELSTDNTQDIRHMNKSGTLDGIIVLPKLWDSVIEKQGD